MPVSPVVTIENPFIQVSLFEDGGEYTGNVMVFDADPNAGPYSLMLCLWVHSETEYVNGEYKLMTAQEAAAAGVKNYVEIDESQSTCYCVVGEDGSSDPMDFKSLIMSAQTLMPQEDNNMVMIEAVGADGTIYRAAYQGALYGGGGSDVPTEPIPYPFYNFSSASGMSMGPYTMIELQTSSGPVNLNFVGKLDSMEFGPGAYTFCTPDDMTDETEMIFQGGFTQYAMDAVSEDKRFEIVSGKIGVVAPSDANGNKWVFQFQNVYAKAEDGMTFIFGELQDDGSYFCAPSVAKIEFQSGPGIMRK